MRSALAAVLFLAVVDLPAQDAEHATWQAARQSWIEAMKAARETGALRKGGVPPAAVQELEAEVARAKQAYEAAFAAAAPVAGERWLELARVREASREYAGAMECYARYFAGRGLWEATEDAKSDPRPADLRPAERRALRQACITALNSKQPEVAARWMEAAIAADDGDGMRAVRAAYYPRVLIELGRWDDLDAHAAALAEESGDTAAAGTQFLFVARLNAGRLAEAEALLDAMLEDRDAYPDHQGWAVQGKLAFHASRGEHAAARSLLDGYLARPPLANPRNANEPNARRRLELVARFLGEPADRVHVDTWVGAAEDAAADPVTAFRGKVVLLDFWQPWCEPCRRAMPALVDLQARHRDDLRVVGLCRLEDYGYDVSAKQAVRPIAAGDYPAHVADFRADMGLNYPLGIENGGAASATYGRLGIPTLVAIDRAGVIRYMTIGAGEPGTLELAVEGLLRVGTNDGGERR